MEEKRRKVSPPAELYKTSNRTETCIMYWIGGVLV